MRQVRQKAQAVCVAGHDASEEYQERLCGGLSLGRWRGSHGGHGAVRVLCVLVGALVRPVFCLRGGPKVATNRPSPARVGRLSRLPGKGVSGWLALAPGRD